MHELDGYTNVSSLPGGRLLQNLLARKVCPGPGALVKDKSRGSHEKQHPNRREDHPPMCPYPLDDPHSH
jgi:hypothetical protein